MFINESNTSGDDQAIACRDCGNTFIWTAGEQVYYLERELRQPRRCRQCRDARKAASAYNLNR